MESQMDGDASGARATEAGDALAALAADRGELADRMRVPEWYSPLLAIATALIVGSPGPGILWQFVLVALGCVGIVLLVMAYQRVTGVSATQPAGPRSRTILRVLGIAIVSLLVASFVLVWFGYPLWTWATALGAFVAMWWGGERYNRAYDQELRRDH